MEMLFLILILILNLFVPTSSEESKWFDLFDSKDQIVLASESVPKDTQKVQVVSIVDGDTIDIKINNETKRVRLLLVDTPETSHPLLGSQPYGQEAKDFTKSKIKKFDTVYLETDIDKKDKYGRVLGYIWFKDNDNNWKMINEELIRESYARFAYAYKDYKYIDRFKNLEKTIKSLKKNIWSEDNYVMSNGFNSTILTK